MRQASEQRFATRPASLPEQSIRGYLNHYGASSERGGRPGADAGAREARPGAARVAGARWAATRLRILQLAVLLAAATLALGSVCARAAVPVGSDVRVSQTGADGDPSRDALHASATYNPQAGEYLVLWSADALVADDEYEIFAQRLSASGDELGGDLLISNVGADGDPTRGAFEPAVAYNPQANEYLVVWTADGLATDDEYEIFGRRLSTSGVALSAAFRISTTGADGDAGRDAGAPAVIHNPQAGEYLVVWEADGSATDGEREVFGQRLSAGGAELGADFRVSNVGADGDPLRFASAPALAHGASLNEYLVTWRGDGLATDNEYEIFGQRVSAAGAQVGGDFRISNVATDGDTQRGAFDDASIGYHAAADQYLVVWSGVDLVPDGEHEVFGQLLSAGGAELGGDFRISNLGADGDTARRAQNAAVAQATAAGEQVVVWAGDGLATQGEFEVFGQGLSIAGSQLGANFRISNSGVDGDASRDAVGPAIAGSTQAGEHLVVWFGDGLATDGESEVFARRLVTAIAPSAATAPPAATGPLTGNAPVVQPLDTVRPVISRLRMMRRRFRVGPIPTPRTARRAPAGSAFLFALSERAQVAITIERVLSGRRVVRRGKRVCVRPTRRNAHNRRCPRYLRTGRLTRTLVAGPARVPFSGRIGGKQLRSGLYRASLRATDRAGNRSTVARVRFRIVRR